MVDATDPKGRKEGSERVPRGGSFVSFPGFRRSATRGSRKPADGRRADGFRLVLSGDRDKPSARKSSTGNVRESAKLPREEY